MQKYFIILLLLICPLMIVIENSTASFSGLGVGEQGGKRKPKFEDERWPIVNWNAPEPADPDARAKRQSKNRRYNKSTLVPKPPFYPDNGEVNLINDWEVGFPAIPSDRSTVILTGRVKSAQAYLSEDKSGIYSEFDVNIERVIKNSGAPTVSPDSKITVERVGGRVRTPSGHLQQFGISRQGMPKVSGRYVFFLVGDEEQGYHVLTGYELREGLVFPLDGVDPSDGSKLPQFALYEGMSEASLMQRIEESLAHSSQGTSNH